MAPGDHKHNIYLPFSPQAISRLIQKVKHMKKTFLNGIDIIVRYKAFAHYQHMLNFLQCNQ